MAKLGKLCTGRQERKVRCTRFGGEEEEWESGCLDGFDEVLYLGGMMEAAVIVRLTLCV